MGVFFKLYNTMDYNLDTEEKSIVQSINEINISKDKLEPIVLINNYQSANFLSLELVTFTYPGIFNTIASIFPEKRKIIIADSGTLSIHEVVDYYQNTDGTYELCYLIGLSVSFAIVKDDDSVNISRRYFIPKRFVASDYGILGWHNASGTSLDLYNALKRIVSTSPNQDGISGILCDNNQTMIITGVTSTTLGTLYVSYTNPGQGNSYILIIKSDGAYQTQLIPKIYTLWADNYTLISSGMKRPDAWLVADGIDTGLYETIDEAYKNGCSIVLKEYSYNYAGKLNQYTVKSIVDNNNGYSLYFDYMWTRYCLTIFSNGQINVTSN